jgi:hypothetical protein
VNRPYRLAAAAAALLLCQGVALAATKIAPAGGSDRPTAVPPADARTTLAPKQAELAAPAGTPARRIDLAPPSKGDLADLVKPRSGPLPIGVARELPVASRVIRLRDLTWAMTTAGTRVAHVKIDSPGAAAMRVALAIDQPVAGMRVRFAGSSGVLGEATAADVAGESKRSGQYWSPDLGGEVATIELEVPSSAVLDDAVIRVPRISHLVVGGADLVSPASAIARATGIGAAEPCNVDLACVNPADGPAIDLAKSVARITFVNAGRTYLCTATLINDSIASNTPYMWTASHCIDSQPVAGTLNAYFFFVAGTCNNKATPPFVQLGAGSKLLGRSQDNDWSIVRLNQPAPAGSRFAAWRADPLNVGTPVVSLHHPSGDLLKYSKGSMTKHEPLIDDLVHGLFNEIVWEEGVTEGGSSGAAIATLAPGGFYEVRGGLYGGVSSCQLQAAPDYYSRFEAALPLMREHLTPTADMQGKVAAVEFYNAALDHYFLSTNPVEIDNLDSGRTVGWVRTGLRFLAHSVPAPGTSPVCRFYRAPAYGDSHFYSASPSECAATAAAHPVDWIYESPSVFYVRLPDAATGACPAGTVAVYRFFNNWTTNHRYTTEQVIRDEMNLSPRWIAEGYGPGPFFPIMCGETT